MPDPNTEHGLRVQLATALRERDELALRAEHFAARILAAEAALAAARRECDLLREELAKRGNISAPHSQMLPETP